MRRTLLCVFTIILSFFLFPLYSYAASYHLDDSIVFSESVVSNDRLYISGKRNDNAYLCCLDDSFQLVWETEFGGSGSDLYSAIAVREGLVIAVGYGSSKDGDLASICHETLWESQFGDKFADDAFISAFDAVDGKELWTQCVGTPCADSFSAVSFSPDGQSIYVYGWRDAPSHDSVPIDTEEEVEFLSRALRYIFDLEGNIIENDCSPALSYRSYRGVFFTDRELIVPTDNGGTICPFNTWIHCDTTEQAEAIFEKTDRSKNDPTILFADSDMFLVSKSNDHLSLRPVEIGGLPAAAERAELDSKFNLSIIDIDKKENGNYLVLGSSQSEDLAKYSSNGKVYVLCETDPDLNVIDTRYGTDPVDGMFVFNGELYFTFRRNAFTEFTATPSESNVQTYQKNKIEKEYDPLVTNFAILTIDILCAAAYLLVKTVFALRTRKQKKLRRAMMTQADPSSSYASSVIINRYKGRIFIIEPLALMVSTFFFSKRIHVAAKLRSVVPSSEYIHRLLIDRLMEIATFCLLILVFSLFVILFRRVNTALNRYNLQKSVDIITPSKTIVKTILTGLLILVSDAALMGLVLFIAVTVMAKIAEVMPLIFCILGVIAVLVVDVLIVIKLRRKAGRR